MYGERDDGYMEETKITPIYSGNKIADMRRQIIFSDKRLLLDHAG